MGRTYNKPGELFGNPTTDYNQENINRAEKSIKKLASTWRTPELQERIAKRIAEICRQLVLADGGKSLLNKADFEELQQYLDVAIAADGQLQIKIDFESLAHDFIVDALQGSRKARNYFLERTFGFEKNTDWDFALLTISFGDEVLLDEKAFIPGMREAMMDLPRALDVRVEVQTVPGKPYNYLKIVNAGLTLYDEVTDESSMTPEELAAIALPAVETINASRYLKMKVKTLEDLLQIFAKGYRHKEVYIMLEYLSVIAGFAPKLEANPTLVYALPVALKNLEHYLHTMRSGQLDIIGGGIMAQIDTANFFDKTQEIFGLKMNVTAIES
jgi:hypothetical protein